VVKYNIDMNKLSIDKKVKIISALVEGNSIRATCRITGAAKGTVTRLLESVGKACSKYQNEHLRNLDCNNVMKFGPSAMQNKKMSPKINKVNLDMVMYGHLLLLTQIQN